MILQIISDICPMRSVDISSSAHSDNKLKLMKTPTVGLLIILTNPNKVTRLGFLEKSGFFNRGLL